MLRQALANEAVGVKITSLGLGPVTSHDVDMAATLGSKLVAFNVRAPHSAVALQAKIKEVDIASERVIYHLLTRVGGWMADALPKVEREEVMGAASVMQVGGAWCVWGLAYACSLSHVVANDVSACLQDSPKAFIVIWCTFCSQ